MSITVARVKIDGIDATVELYEDGEKELQSVTQIANGTFLSIPPDMLDELVDGAEVWHTYVDDGSGGKVCMLRLPNGRGAICENGPSYWGDWSGSDEYPLLRLDEPNDETGIDFLYNEHGHELTEEEIDALG
jgi:hypothetical protein